MPARLQASTEVVRHGIDVEAVAATLADRDAVRRELGLDGRLVVGTVANMRATKGWPDLLAAARQVLDEVDDATFLAVGQGPMEEEIHRLHEQLGLGDRFRLLGFRPDAVRIMAGCDVFCLASHHEGLPIAVMEAMALGLPIVATDVGGLSELVVDRRPRPPRAASPSRSPRRRDRRAAHGRRPARAARRPRCGRRPSSLSAERLDQASRGDLRGARTVVTEATDDAGDDIARVEADHWRAMADEKSAELQRLKRRPLVRAALALDRRLEPGRRAITVRWQRWRAAGRKAAVTAGAAASTSGPRHSAAPPWRLRSQRSHRRRDVRERSPSIEIGLRARRLDG